MNDLDHLLVEMIAAARCRRTALRGMPRPGRRDKIRLDKTASVPGIVQAKPQTIAP
jgi:hypothetical protein